MARSALCVGINEFKNLPVSSWLSGCVNDANDMAAALRKRGFASRSTTVLRDGEATKEAVMRALTSMVVKAKPGDHLVFSFSSHGTRVPNQPDDDSETDGLDDAFACHDIKPAGDQWDWATVIIDDELRELFTHVLEGIFLEVFLDTCHGGTGLRDLDEIQLDMSRTQGPLLATADAARSGPGANARRRVAAHGRPPGPFRTHQAGARNPSGDFGGVQANADGFRGQLRRPVERRLHIHVAQGPPRPAGGDPG